MGEYVSFVASLVIIVLSVTSIPFYSAKVKGSSLFWALVLVDISLCRLWPILFDAFLIVKIPFRINEQYLKTSQWFRSADLPWFWYLIDRLFIIGGIISEIKDTMKRGISDVVEGFEACSNWTPYDRLT